MANSISTIQSLKAVDAWIDVINANINGGVRTAYKTSRLKFAGSNTNLDRAGNATSLPLQFPEPSLVTQNTVIDFSQGAITSSTENSHLAIQGEGYFLLASPDLINTTMGPSFGMTLPPTAQSRLYLTRDGEFRTNQYGMLVNSAGYYLVTSNWDAFAPGVSLYLDDTWNDSSSNIRAVFNDLDNKASTTTGYVNLSEFLKGDNLIDASGNNMWGFTSTSLGMIISGEQTLKMTSQGATVFDFGWHYVPDIFSASNMSPLIKYGSSMRTDATILSKSLEASNASMTQSVPELSLAQKLFSALTKVLQTSQTNLDNVLNLVR